MPLTGVLAFPSAYVAFQRLVWGRALRELASVHIRPELGLRVLDLGCGPADLLRSLPGVRYLGVDHDRRYIAMARRTFGDRGTFVLADVTDPPALPSGEFDLVLAKGLVHHLDDAAAAGLLSTAYEALRPGGRLVAVDGACADDESRLAHFVTSLDRGKYIRKVDKYSALLSEVFGKVDLRVRHDLLRIPYTLAIADCTR